MIYEIWVMDTGLDEWDELVSLTEKERIQVELFLAKKVEEGIISRFTVRLPPSEHPPTLQEFMSHFPA